MVHRSPEIRPVRLFAVATLLNLILLAAPALAAGELVQVIPNVSLFIQMGNFLVLMIVLNFLLFRPIRRKLAERSAHFSKFRTEIDDLGSKTTKRAKELDDLLAEARRQGGTKREELKRQGQDTEKSLVDKATTEMEKSVAQVREQVRAELGSARDELRGQVEAFSRQVAEKILGRSL